MAPVRAPRAHGRLTTQPRVSGRGRSLAPSSPSTPSTSPRCTAHTTAGCERAASSRGQACSVTRSPSASGAKPGVGEGEQHPLAAVLDRSELVAQPLAPGPAAAHGRRVEGATLAGVQPRGEGHGEGGVLRLAREVGPRGATASAAPTGDAAGAPGRHQRVEVAPQRVGVQAGRVLQLRQRQRPAGVAQRRPGRGPGQP